MPKLPVLSGDDVIKALSRIGYNFDNQIGSHITLVNPSVKRLQSQITESWALDLMTFSHA